MNILLLDIETAPNVGLTWGKYEQNVIDFVREWYMLCFSAKWLDKKEVISHSLPDFNVFKKNKRDDKELLKKLWELLDQADIVIAHNGDNFDIRKSNARFAFHNIKPPSPYRTIDTYKVAKRYFDFNSNKLDDLGKHLKLGRKVKHEGFELWQKCMDGNREAFKTMVAYNKQDVLLLEKVYIYLRPWITNHPNIAVFSEKIVCPKCSGKDLIHRGYAATNTSRFKVIFCKTCEGWSRFRLSEPFKPTHI